VRETPTKLDLIIAAWVAILVISGRWLLRKKPSILYRKYPQLAQQFSLPFTTGWKGQVDLDERAILESWRRILFMWLCGFLGHLLLIYVGVCIWTYVSVRHKL
jgi:hypothetical protein